MISCFLCERRSILSRLRRPSTARDSKSANGPMLRKSVSTVVGGLFIRRGLFLGPHLGLSSITQLIKAGHACLDEFFGGRGKLAFCSCIGGLEVGRTRRLLLAARRSLIRMTRGSNFGSLSAFQEIFRKDRRYAPGTFHDIRLPGGRR